MKTVLSLLLLSSTIIFGSLPAHAGNGTISGTVTSDESGSPAIAGGLVRTYGEPYYSAVTDSNGVYTFSAPSGTYVLLTSAVNHVPQRLSVVVASGSSTAKNIALRPASAIGGSVVNLPSPLEWGEPAAAPMAPGDSFPVVFSNTAAVPVPSAPQISGWNDNVMPDESFTMSGARFTTRTGSDEGTDTIVWVWARTSAGAGVLKQCKLWHVKENVLTAALPDDIPFGMYLVWVENSDGVSLPICLNKTTAAWVGPLGNTVQAGNTKRVFGRNITYGHGTAVSYVYIQPAGGGSFISCPITSKVNPYMVEFTVPANTPNGSYKVYAHNGQGGVYGWSDGLDLIVQPDFARDTYEMSLAPGGSDDTSAIQSALNSLSARPNGGTLRLQAGTYKTYDAISLKAKTRIVGAGMDSTTIELRLNQWRHDYVNLAENNVTVENLTLKGCLGTVAPGYGFVGGNVSTTDNFKMVGVRVASEWGVVAMLSGWGSTRTEMSNCEFNRAICPGATDGWVHDSTLYGGPFGLYDPYTFETEGAYGISVRSVLEDSHIETKDWPVNQSNGSTNYMDFITYNSPAWNSQMPYKVWAKRVAIANFCNCHDSYIGNLSSWNVAVEDNKGEMILYHGGTGQWFGNVVSTNGLTLNLRTDGTVNGLTGAKISSGASMVTGGQPVPDSYPSYVPINGSCVSIMAGKGLGQARYIVSHSSTSVTVDTPWRILPDATSVVLISPLYINNVVYDNDLNAFPPGYVQDGTASIGIDIDGYGWNNACEGNTSHRTNSGRSILATYGTVSYWNVMRGENAVDAHNYGYAISSFDENSFGHVLLGNAYRSSRINIYDSALAGAVRMYGEGCIAEKMDVTAKWGYQLSGATTPNAYSEAFTLYRRGNVHVIDGPSSPSAPEPVYIGQTDARQMLIDNNYSGSSQNYYLANGLSGYTIPVSPYKVAKFTGYVGYPLQPVMMPLANAGISSMTWTATSTDGWITPSIQANGTLAAEATLGRLVVSVNTTGMSAGRHWGSVTINSGTGSVKVGVCVDLSSGAPPNATPAASFTATPLAGAAALAVNFNAGSSSDPDGTIQSYVWDFGDGTYGSGVTATHTYTSANTYTPALTVTDDLGAISSAWTNVSVCTELTDVSVAGTPVGAIDVNTPVSLTAAATGGYLVQYRFMLKDVTGWHVLRDYSSSNTFTWTPTVAGYYELKAQARNTGSTNTYDEMSGILSYPVGLLPTGMKIWLKADAGISGPGPVSAWADQSGTGNSVSQTNGSYMPTLTDAVLNGRPVVRFAGPSQILAARGQVLNGSTSFTAFTLAKLNQISTPKYQYFWWDGPDSSTGGYGCFMNTANNIRSGWGSYASAPTYATPATVGALYQITSRFTNTAGSGPNELWVNGTYVGSRTKNDSFLSGGFFSVGNFGPSAGSGLYGDIGEIIIYDKSLSDTERANVESYLTSRWAAAAPVTKDRLRDIKALNDGVLVSITSAKIAITASGVYSDGSIYVSESDRTAGMKVTGAGTVSFGDNLILTGITDTDASTGEKMLRVTGVTTGANTPLGSLGMSNKTLAATGQLVTIWGKVTAKTTSYITVDDGSGSAAKVQIDGLVSPITKTVNIGDYISATGPCGTMAGGVTAVRVRSGSDIQIY